MILVDSNVILDVTGQDPKWMEWSAKQVTTWGLGILAINCLIYAELSIDYGKSDDLDTDISEWGLTKLDLPYEAAFLAGQAFVEYRKRGEAEDHPCPTSILERMHKLPD